MQGEGGVVYPTLTERMKCCLLIWFETILISRVNFGVELGPCSFFLTSSIANMLSL